MRAFQIKKTITMIFFLALAALYFYTLIIKSKSCAFSKRT